MDRSLAYVLLPEPPAPLLEECTRFWLGYAFGLDFQDSDILPVDTFKAAPLEAGLLVERGRARMMACGIAAALVAAEEGLTGQAALERIYEVIGADDPLAVLLPAAVEHGVDTAAIKPYPFTPEHFASPRVWPRLSTSEGVAA